MKNHKKIQPDLSIWTENRSIGSHHDQHSNAQYGSNKFSSSSLNKYNRSPYIKKITHGFTLPKKSANNYPIASNFHDSSGIKENEGDPDNNFQSITIFKKNDAAYESKQHQRSHSNMNMSSEQKQKGMKFKLPKLDMEAIKNDKKQKLSSNTLSATLDATAKKKKLIPLNHSFKSQTAVKTKPGTNGTQTKINQDIAIIETNLPHSVKLYCVCDGHGLNGHLVSAFIKQNLIKNLNTALKKYTAQPQQIELIFEECLAKTNDGLLNSDINTQLSGSTVIAVFVYKQTIYSFNIGDSRAILVSEVGEENWKVIPLSDDQKPCRQDEKQRIIKFGGRVEAQTNERGQILGPLRVWMKDVQMPGLAMTRSFGDKAGIKAGTTGQPQLKIHKINPQDKYMVIASDGVWQYLQSQEVMNIINPFYKKNDVDLAAQKIVRIASQIWNKVSYSRDDITLIIVSLNPPKFHHHENGQKGYGGIKYSEEH